MFIRGLGTGNFERRYKYYKSDKTPLPYNSFRFKGDKHRFHVNGEAKYIRIFFKDVNESNVNIDNIVISPYRNILDFTNKVIDMRGTTTYNLFNYINRTNVANTLLDRTFTINSDKVVRNALIPLFLHKGERKPGVSITERHIYLGDALQNDFSDVGIFKEGKLLNSRFHAGNYALVPQNTYMKTMCQDVEDKFLLGSNLYEGIYKSIDNGLTWAKIIEDAKLLFVSRQGDLYFQRNSNGLRSILRATKSSNYTTINTVYSTSTLTLVAMQSSFCQNELNGDLYFAPYQEQFNVEVFKSTDGGATWNRVYYNPYKQHVHKVWIKDGVIYLNVDGATIQNPNDEESTNNSMAVYKSLDNGVTWELVKYEWSTDYGINTFNNGYFYGMAESNIKYAPAIFRSKDLKNWQSVWNIPANSQAVKSYDGTMINGLIAYESFNRAKHFISNNGEDFLPIFDTKHLDSNDLATSLRYGTQEIYNTYFESDGEKWVAMVAGTSDLTNHRLILGGDNFQALCYIQCNLEIGDNVFTIKNTTERNDIIKNHYNDSFYQITFKEKYLTDGNDVKYFYFGNSIISDGRFDGFNYPFTLKKETSISLYKPITINNEIHGVKSIRFGYKSYRYSTTGVNEVGIMSIGDVSMSRRNTNIIVKIDNIEYQLTNMLRVYYDTTCLDINIVFNGSKLQGYINGFLKDEVDCAIDSINGSSITIQPDNLNKSADFITNIEFYDYVITTDRSKELLEGFNLV